MYLPVDIIAPIPKPGEPGYFGVSRKYDMHTGIDLYTNDEEPVYALYHGTVVNIENFTGERLKIVLHSQLTTVAIVIVPVL